MSNHTPGAVPPEQLAPAIINIAKFYKEDPILITKLILVESKAKEGSINHKTLDYGLMQINLKTANANGISMTCLMDWKCNLLVGTGLLHRTRKPGGFRPCMWNTGRIGSKKYPLACLKYENKIASLN